MSLLMDALKQAEHAKRDRQSESPPPDMQVERVSMGDLPTSDNPPTSVAELSLTPVETSADAETAPPNIAPDIPEAPPHLRLATAPEPPELPELIDTPRADTPTPEPVIPAPVASAPAVTAASAETDHHTRQAAARILAASDARQATQRRRDILGLISLGAVLVIAIGGYYYYATLAQQAPYLGLPQPPAVATADVSPVDQPLADATPAVPAALDTTAAPAPALPETSPPAQTAWQEGPPPAEASITQDWEPAPVDPRVLQGEQPSQFADVAEEAAPTTDAGADAGASIRITRSTQPNRVSLDLQAAYGDFQAGRLAQAEQAYRQVLTRDAENRDARMGLAAIAVKNGQLDVARAQYRAVLRRNPKDLTAQAALTDLGQNRLAANSESQLKTLLAEQPQSAQLHFALANLYAEQQRWPYAQQAYFEAQRLAPEQPDYAFNLAVSLDHLGQPQPALEYYRRAVQLAGSHNAQFDLNAARQRIGVLTGVLAGVPSAQARP